MFSNVVAGLGLLLSAAFLPDTSTMTPFATKMIDCNQYAIHALAYDPNPAEDALVVEYRVGGVLIAVHDARDQKVYIVEGRLVLSAADAAAKYDNNLCRIPVPKTA